MATASKPAISPIMAKEGFKVPKLSAVVPGLIFSSLSKIVKPFPSFTLILDLSNKPAFSAFKALA